MDAENIMRIEPLKAPLDGAATVPGDKSISAPGGPVLSYG